MKLIIAGNQKELPQGITVAELIALEKIAAVCLKISRRRMLFPPANRRE